MAVLVSSLIRGMDELESVAQWVNGLKDPEVGVELIAFTHDEGYWKRLEGVLEKLECPVSFHGPYLKTEGTASAASEAGRFLLDSYHRVLALAAQHSVCHVVYHMTQKTFTDPLQPPVFWTQAEENAGQIMELGRQYSVPVLIENLPCPADRIPLYTNEQYASFFRRFPTAESLIDIGHAHMTGLRLKPFLACHGDRVRAYHFHNNDGTRDQHNDIFDGTFDFSQFAPVFRAYTPKANIVLEYEPHVQKSLQDLEQEICYIKEHFYR